MINNILYNFMELVENETIEIYNEFSLQHELGIFLRNNLAGYKVQFERNTKFFKMDGMVKHEIDIVIYNESEKYAVELKYPVNGQYPEQMYAFIKDICFMEELKMAGFDKTYCLTVVKDKDFYLGARKDGIYAYFRDRKAISGKIIKPTGKKDSAIQLKQEYVINWHGDRADMKYYIVEI